MYWEDKDGNKYELPTHCVNSPIGDCYYYDGNTMHQVERVLNPLTTPLGMVGMLAFIGKECLGSQNKKERK